MQNAKELERVRRLAKTGAARAIREAADVSLAEAAGPVRVDRSTISKWERGVRRPRGEAAIRYLRLLDELSGVGSLLMLLVLTFAAAFDPAVGTRRPRSGARATGPEPRCTRRSSVASYAVFGVVVAGWSPDERSRTGSEVVATNLPSSNALGGWPRAPLVPLGGIQDAGYPQHQRVGGEGQGQAPARRASLATGGRRSRVVPVRQGEGPLAEDLRRLKGLRPDVERFRFNYGQGVDLARADHVAAVLRAIEGCAVCVLDTLSACWGADESDNAAFSALDAQVLSPITAAGCTPVILDHTGHAQAFVSRRGVSAPRGASSKGQKVDVLIEFRPVAPSEFRLEVAKMRVGGIRPRPVGCRVVDLDDDGLDIETQSGAVDPVVSELAEQMVVAIENAGELTTNALRAAAPASRENQAEAIRLLETEDPPRVRVTPGPNRSKLWVPVTWGLE